MSEQIEKLTFEDKDFKFMAAYNAYSDHFEGVDEEGRANLNEAITKLHKEEITYPEFYEALNTEGDSSRPFHRSRIMGSRKFAYRKSERKIDRIRRHK